MRLIQNNTTIKILLFFTLFFAGAYFHHPVEYDNSKSRYFLISAVVDFKTLAIDAYQDWTIDKSYFNGHYYSNKAPGAPLLGIPIYWVLRHVNKPSPVPLTLPDRYLVRLFTTTLPFAILGILLFQIGNAWCYNPQKSLWMVLAYSFGSIAFQQAAIFSGHQISASFSFFSFFIIHFLSVANTKNTITWKHSCLAFLSGLFVGVAALSDYTAMYIALVMSIYVIWSKMPIQHMILFFCGGLICIIILGYYNLSCFGSIFSLSYGYQATEAFKKGSEFGLLGVSLPNPKSLFFILLSPARGLFFIMPVFLFSIFGFFRLYKRKELFRETIVLLSIVFGYLTINAGFYAWHGGWSFGPRYLVPMLPFFALPIIFSPWHKAIFFTLLCISVFQVWISVIGFPHTPEDILNPIAELILPCMKYGYFSQNLGTSIGMKELWSLIPLALITCMGIVTLFYRINHKIETEPVPKAIKIISLAWILIIIFMLIFYKTPQKKQVHGNRGLLLMDAAIMTKSEHLRQSSLNETKQAKTMKGL